MVILQVGEGDKATKFMMHNEFACYYSSVFKAAFNSKFMEGQTQIYHLLDAYEKIVCLLIQWIYTQRKQIASD